MNIFRAIKPAAMKEIKNILNAPDNMAFVDADVNRAVRL